MKLGTIYGIGVGPGDPELISIKGARILSGCRHVFVPKTRMEKESTALAIARGYIPPNAVIHELVFPMTTDRSDLSQQWGASALRIASVIRTGEDACFLTLGDPFLYSTYVYLLRAVRARVPDVKAVTIPGITSFCAAAAQTEFSLGEGNETVSIVPTPDNFDRVREALARKGTVVLMKVGRHLGKVLDILEELKLLGHGVFASRIGMDGETTEVDLSRLKQAGREAGYFSILLVRNDGDDASGQENKADAAGAGSHGAGST